MLFLRFLPAAIFQRARLKRDRTVDRAHTYITSGLHESQTFRKMRLRQRSHSSIQQNITAPKE
jgi:hypothetical protein